MDLTKETVLKLGRDLRSIAMDDSNSSPSGFFRRAFQQSSAKSVYTAPRNANDGFPPRNNTLKDKNNFTLSYWNIRGFGGMSVTTTVSIDNTGMHKSIFGKTKGQGVYPWIWIDEGRTHKNRFSGNPANIKQNFIRDWHTDYRDIYVNKVATQLRRRGWDVEV